MQKISKFLLIALIAILIVPCSVIFMACSSKNNNDDNGVPPQPQTDDGTDGLPSAPPVNPFIGGDTDGTSGMFHIVL